jgi:phosphatidylglycerol---prolipoprotein diacylglyceryl transferase
MLLFAQPLAMLSYIIWDADPVLIRFGDIEARWYGLFFAAAFFFGQYVITLIFKGEGKPARDVDALTVFMMVATIVGARLGHCLFYEPDYYLANPIEILKIWKGGLASHGATIGIILAMYFYSRGRKGQSFLWILDRIVIVVALGGAFIRMGNLMNSEIVGKPARLPYSFVFVRPAHEVILASAPGVVSSVSFSPTGKDLNLEGGQELVLVRALLKGEGTSGTAQLEGYVNTQMPGVLLSSDEVHEHIRPEDAPLNTTANQEGVSVELAAVPRHPAQLYESLSTFALFVGLFLLWRKLKGRTPEGLLFGIFVTVLFTLRFLYEFLKENQVEFEEELAYNMGQLLSIPMVLIGVVVLVLAIRKGPPKEIAD